MIISQTTVDVRGIGSRNREEQFLEKELSQRFFWIQRRCQKSPAPKPELPLRVQILNNVGELQPHEFEFDLALRWHGALLESGSSVGRHLQLEKLIEQGFDIGCLDSISSMKEHMVFANDDVARGQVTCGATCCHCPSQAMTAPMSAPPIRTVNLFLRVMRNVKELTPVLSQCRVIAETNLGIITLAMCCLFSVVPVLTKYVRRSSKIPSTFDYPCMLWSLTTLHKLINSLSFNSSQCCKNVCNASVERIEKISGGSLKQSHFKSLGPKRVSVPTS